ELAIGNSRQALQATEDLADALNQAQAGKWAGFYAGERLSKTAIIRDRIRATLALLQGKPVPPLRREQDFHFRSLYDYQTPFLERVRLHGGHRRSVLYTGC